MAGRSWPTTAGRSRKPVSPSCANSCSRSASCTGVAGEDPGVAAVLLAGEGVEAVAAGGGLGRVVVEEDHQVGEDVQPLLGAARRLLFGADLGEDRAGLSGVVRGGVADVGGAGHQAVGDGVVREGGHQGLALRRAGGDGGALDAEVAALEVDVVQLVAVDETPGADVTDLRVVLPAVPEAAHDLDVVARLVEEVGHQFAGGRGVVGLDAGKGTAAEVGGLGGAGGDLDAQARPAGADVVEGGDGLGDVERLGVGGHHGRDEAYAAGQRGDPGGDQDGVELGRGPGRCARPGPGSGRTAGRGRPRW